VPTDFLVDTEHRAVFTLAVGELTVLELMDSMARLLNDPRFLPSFRHIADFRPVTTGSVSSADIRSLAKRTVFDAASRRAMIVDQSQPGSGTVRQYAEDRGQEGENNVRAVNTLEQAAEWTGVDLDATKQAMAELAERLKAG
jgi:hypothetical protein